MSESSNFSENLSDSDLDFGLGWRPGPVVDSRNVLHNLHVWQQQWSNYQLRNWLDSAPQGLLVETPVHLLLAEDVRSLDHCPSVHQFSREVEPAPVLMAPALRCPYCALFLPNVAVFAAHISEFCSPELFCSSRGPCPAFLCLHTQTIISLMAAGTSRGLPHWIADTVATTAQGPSSGQAHFQSGHLPYLSLLGLT